MPWDYDFNADEWDGLFVSNGPGDPSWCEITITNIKKAMALEPPKYFIREGILHNPNFIS